MPKRQARSLPKLWLMTDERFGDALLPTIAALPRGSGIIFRHYSLDPIERQALFTAVSVAARRYHHYLVVAGPALSVRRWQVAGVHTKGRAQGAVLHTAPVHSAREAVAATRAGTDLLFVSPVFATGSHPNAKVLGRVRFGLLIRTMRKPVIALGGMNKPRARSLRAMKIYGWAAIAALAVTL